MRLLELSQLRQDRLIYRANPVVFIEEHPAYDALFVHDDDGRLCDRTIRVQQIVRFNHLVIGV